MFKFKDFLPNIIWDIIWDLIIQPIGVPIVGGALILSEVQIKGHSVFVGIAMSLLLTIALFPPYLYHSLSKSIINPTPKEQLKFWFMFWIYFIGIFAVCAIAAYYIHEKFLVVGF